MEIMLFVKDDCPRCPAAMKVLEDFDGVLVYNIDEMDGLAEASFHSVLATPSILVLDSGGKEVGGWRGEIPSASDVRNLVVQ